MIIRVSLAAVVVAIAVTLAACGSSKSSTTTTQSVASAATAAPKPKPKPAAPATLSHAQLAQRADTACTTANRKIAGLSAPTELADLGTYATQVQVAFNQLESQLAALKPSTGDAQKFAAFQHALSADSTNLRDLLAAANKSDRLRVKAYSEKIAESGLGVFAARAGLAACSATGKISG